MDVFFFTFSFCPLAASHSFLSFCFSPLCTASAAYSSLQDKLSAAQQDNEHLSALLKEQAEQCGRLQKEMQEMREVEEKRKEREEQEARRAKD